MFLACYHSKRILIPTKALPEKLPLQHDADNDLFNHFTSLSGCSYGHGSTVPCDWAARLGSANDYSGTHGYGAHRNHHGPEHRRQDRRLERLPRGAGGPALSPRHRPHGRPYHPAVDPPRLFQPQEMGERRLLQPHRKHLQS